MHAVVAEGAKHTYRQQQHNNSEGRKISDIMNQFTTTTPASSSAAVVATSPVNSSSSSADNNGGAPRNSYARVLGSATAGVSELLLFHPVDTVAKRLMSNQTVAVKGQPTAEAMAALNKVCSAVVLEDLSVVDYDICLCM